MAHHGAILDRLTVELEAALGRPLSIRVGTSLELAYRAHTGQHRSGRSGRVRQPYIVHPVGTALNVVQYFSSVNIGREDLEAVVCVALLHDVLEDTTVRPEEIEAAAGRLVRCNVEALTKPPISAAESSEERTSRFIRQIVAAGPIVAFVKVCDSLHNLRRPYAIPPGLLIKTVKKCESYYIGLLGECQASEPLLSDYARALEAARRCLSAPEAPIPIEPSLEAAVSAAVLAGSEKTLEPHDIADSLKGITGASRCLIWRVIRRHGHAPQVMMAAGDWAAVPVLRVLDGLDGACSGNSRQGKVLLDSLGFGDVAEALFAKEAIDSDEYFVCCAAFSVGERGEWLNEAAFSGLVRLLFHRLLVGRAYEHTRLSDEAARAGIKIDIGVARQLHATPAQLQALASWLSVAREALEKAEYVVKAVIRRSEYLAEQCLRVESRLKSADAILRKCVRQPRRRWPSFEDMDDIAGVRVVCMTQEAAYEVVRRLMSPEAESLGLVRGGGNESAIRDYVDRPSDEGYMAVHILLAARARGDRDDERLVPCEIQIRTLCQDTWARVSHAASYRRRRDRRARESMKTLGAALQACQAIVDRVFSGKGGEGVQRPPSIP